MAFKLGIERLVSEASLRTKLQGKRVALVGHPASVTQTLEHSLDVLIGSGKFNVTAAFGPQHGMRGDKQDNMVESADYVDPIHGIPVFSLYGDVRRPTDAMLDTFDVLLFDVQDLGCRIYTYITTLLYLLEACAAKGKALWVLDRPNPAGRPVEGTLLEAGWESFVGAGSILMRHGLTVGEIARWFVVNRDLDVDLKVIEMRDYDPTASPGYGWPTGKLAWVNPSPNASSLNMARCYAGTVLLEGVTLSEGRGTTIPLEVVGAPDIDIDAILKAMQKVSPKWLSGAFLRRCWFEPTFHKHQGKLCRGFQFHTDTDRYIHARFKPFRVIVLFLKALRMVHPDYDLWRKHAYEYEMDRLPIDLINGGSFVREWIDGPSTDVHELEARLASDEQDWQEQIALLYLYPH